jgi:hypothetical protein
MPFEVCDSAVAQEMLCWLETKTKEDAHARRIAGNDPGWAGCMEVP